MTETKCKAGRLSEISAGKIRLRDKTNRDAILTACHILPCFIFGSTAHGCSFANSERVPRSNNSFYHSVDLGTKILLVRMSPQPFDRFADTDPERFARLKIWNKP